MHVLGRLMTKQELLRSLRTRLLLTAAIDATPADHRRARACPGDDRRPRPLRARRSCSNCWGCIPTCEAPIGAEALHPVPLPETGLADRLEAGQCEQEFWADIQPEFLTMHEFRADLPVECITPHHRQLRRVPLEHDRPADGVDP